jgi:hypothetical protein
VTKPLSCATGMLGTWVKLILGGDWDKTKTGKEK